GQQLALGELDEPGLIGSDLVDVHLVEPGIEVFGDLLDMALDVRSAWHQLRDLVLGHGLRQLLEMGRARQLLADLAVERDRRPPFERRPARLGFGPRPADGDLADPGTGPAGLAVAV